MANVHTKEIRSKKMFAIKASVMLDLICRIYSHEDTKPTKDFS